MRLFIAIDLDEEARAAIAAEQKRLKAAIDETRSSIKWVPADHMHLTLVFLGEVPDANVPAVVGALTEPLRQLPFELEFGGIGVFPLRGAPNVLWLGVAAGAGETVDLQCQLADRIRPLGIALEGRPFHPHLTLARWRTSRGADRRRALEESVDRAVARVHVDHATLYQSRLSSAGPTYIPLARANLLAALS